MAHHPRLTPPLLPAEPARQKAALALARLLARDLALGEHSRTDTEMK
jgi:hypothetical protein